MKQFYSVLVLCVLSGLVSADCTITWSDSNSTEVGVTGYNIYHIKTTGIVKVGTVTTTTTTCDAHGITRIGSVGVTIVNAAGESQMLSEAFEPESATDLRVN